MLKLIFPMMLLLHHHNRWNNTMIFITLIMVTSITMVSPYNWCTPHNNMMVTDFLSSSLLILTMWITPLMMMASQTIYINKNKHTQFIKIMSILTLILIMSFTMNNLLTFYILFEASLLPTLMIVLMWGYQPERIQAGMYLMMYTIVGSLPLLILIVYTWNTNLTLSIITSSTPHFSSTSLKWFIMNMAFMVKLPMFMAHLWLPKAHVEAPVAGSMILAAILLKLGGYGMMRMALFMGPLTKTAAHALMSLVLWGGMITSMMCVRQPDMKSLIAYSSVGHMSLVLAGVITNNMWGMWGALGMMIAHGLVSSSMFANANFTYEISNSRNLFLNKGIHITLPVISMLWFIMCAANMAAPPMINLWAEIMTITATLSAFSMMVPLASMSYLAAVYSLVLYTTINHGSVNSSMSSYSTNKMNHVACLTFHLIPVVIMILTPMFVSIW